MPLGQSKAAGMQVRGWREPPATAAPTPTAARCTRPTRPLHFDMLAGRTTASAAWIDHLGRWDTVHFVRIAKCGYETDMSNAFFPLLPLLMRTVASMPGAPTCLVMPQTWRVPRNHARRRQGGEREELSRVTNPLASSTYFVLFAVQALALCSQRRLCSRWLAWLSAWHPSALQRWLYTGGTQHSASALCAAATTRLFSLHLAHNTTNTPLC